VALERLDRRACDVAAGVLLDAEVGVRERGDLREVRDAEDLAVGREAAQALAHGARGLAADARVDLVEHQRRVPARVRDAHQREHHA
jgi:hypothetical protein